MIVVDSGDLFFPPGSSPSSPVGRAKEMTSLMVDLFIKTYNLMGYNAFTPGEIDLSWGIDELQKISKRARFAFLLSNLLDKKTKEPVFTPFLIKKTGGGKIGLLGLISDRFSLPSPPGEKERFQIAEPIETARKIIAELKKNGCQIIIALAHMEDHEQKKLAQTFPAIHFILSGHFRQFSPQPITVNNIEIIRAGTRGEYLGQMDFFIKKKEKILSSHFQLIPLREVYPDHYQTAKLVEEFKMKLVELKYARDKAVVQEAPSGSQSQPMAYVISSYVGDETCLSCHPQQHQQWKKTGHARAYQTLVLDQRSSDHTCLPCHTTGFEESSKGGEILENVQCEACHGPRRGHPEKGERFAPVNEKQCLPCHNPAKSPKYYYETYLERIRCPK
jgi:hypothetical protein